MSAQVFDPAKAVIPKATVNTTAFKLVLASWAMTALVSFLTVRFKILIPAEVKDAGTSALLDAFNYGAPLLAGAFSSWLTKIVVKASVQKNLIKAQAAADIATARQPPSAAAPPAEGA